MSGDWIDDDEAAQSVDLSLWRKLLQYTLHYRRTTWVFSIVALGLASCDLCFPLLTGHLIDEIRVHGMEANLASYGWAFAILSVVFCGFILGFIRCAGKIRTHVSHDIRGDAFERLQQLSFSFYDAKPVGWLMARLTSDCQRLSQILAWGVMDLIWGTTLMTGIAIAMFWHNWRLTLAVLVVVPALFGVSLYFRKWMLKAARMVRKYNSRLTGAYNEAIVGVRTTKVFTRESENLADFERLADQMRLHSVRNAVLSAMYMPIVLTLGSVAIAMALAMGGRQVLLGTLGIGEVVMFMYFAQLFFAPIHDLSMWFAELQMAQASAERVLGLIEAKPEIEDSPEVREQIEALGDDTDSAAIDTIEFHDVSFQYGDGPLVIDRLRLQVEAGQTIALVGSTGGGKSTIVNLLCRFYEPTAGEILIGGVDYRQRSLHWLQSKLGIVLQQPHLFSGTIAENIRYGRLEASDEELVAASQLAGAHDFIEQLEQGYETSVGEGGNQLSLGQKQLVSFARAVLKSPQLLVMDEATSSIDTETEQLIQSGISRVLQGRTSFVIAHRLSTVRAADRILVIEQGKIAEDGRHEELMALRGRYYDLYTEQRIMDR
ncbi:MAG: ABC transporter ATP-binding protein [Planctomycetales bacterium]|nr:ABC transporter ATP-binding protein [Planctomycetales bacterium]